MERRTERKLNFAAGLLALGTLVGACSGAGATPTPNKEITSTPSPRSENGRTITDPKGDFAITGVSEDRNGIFLVTRVQKADTGLTDAFYIGEGERYMVAQGCIIADIKKVSGGDLVYTRTVFSDSDISYVSCLPETK